MTEANLILNMPERQYHAETGHGPTKWLTRSMLHLYSQSPRGYYLRHVRQDERAQPEPPRTYANGNNGRLHPFAEGSIAEAIFCGEKPGINGVYDIRPEFVKTKDGKPTPWSLRCSDAKEIQAKYDEAGVHLISSETESAIKYYLNAACLNPAIDQIREEMQSDVTALQPVIRWVDEKTGLKLQTRPDMVRGGRNPMDLKTSAKSPLEFHKSAYAFGYWLQAYMITYACSLVYEGVDIDTPTAFIVCQKVFPFESGIVIPTQTDLNYADTDYRMALDGIASEEWQNPKTAGVIQKDTPAYVYYDREAE